MVVPDAGPLIHLDELQCLGLLADFSEVRVPEAVWLEVEHHRPQALRGSEVPWRRCMPKASARVDALTTLYTLHTGEREALSLCLEFSGALLLTDDTAARLAANIRELRKQAVGKAYQQALFGDDAATRVAVTDQYAFEFHAQAYAPSRDYDGRFGHFDFRKHFYGRIGDFDSKEEFECACQLDMWAQQGRIRFWVRNPVRREGCSFFLQKADGRFYPDFLCQLPGSAERPGPILAVEYKGADRWHGAEDDRLIGGLWASLSDSRCRFVMVKDKRWEWIEEALK